MWSENKRWKRSRSEANTLGASEEVIVSARSLHGAAAQANARIVTDFKQFIAELKVGRMCGIFRRMKKGSGEWFED
jgi:hypothetical protein